MDPNDDFRLDRAIGGKADSFLVLPGGLLQVFNGEFILSALRIIDFGQIVADKGIFFRFHADDFKRVFRARGYRNLAHNRGADFAP